MSKYYGNDGYLLAVPCSHAPIWALPRHMSTGLTPQSAMYASRHNCRSHLNICSKRLLNRYPALRFRFQNRGAVLRNSNVVKMQSGRQSGDDEGPAVELTSGRGAFLKAAAAALAGAGAMAVTGGAVVVAPRRAEAATIGGTHTRTW